MYKTLESKNAMKEYRQIQFEFARIKERKARSVKRGHSLTWFIVTEMVNYLIQYVLGLTLRSKTQMAPVGE